MSGVLRQWEFSDSRWSGVQRAQPCNQSGYNGSRDGAAFSSFIGRHGGVCSFLRLPYFTKIVGFKWFTKNHATLFFVFVCCCCFLGALNLGSHLMSEPLGPSQPRDSDRAADPPPKCCALRTRGRAPSRFVDWLPGLVLQSLVRKKDGLSNTGPWSSKVLC